MAAVERTRLVCADVFPVYKGRVFFTAREMMEEIPRTMGYGTVTLNAVFPDKNAPSVLCMALGTHTAGLCMSWWSTISLCASVIGGSFRNLSNGVPRVWQRQEEKLPFARLCNIAGV